MKLKIDHIGIAVSHLEESMKKWEEVFGLKAKNIEEIKERGVKLASLDLEGGPSLELVSGLAEDSAVAKFIEQRGEGIHHFCFEVEDIHKAVEKLKKKGVQFVEPVPVKGAEGSLIAFIHPLSLNGVLVELKEKTRQRP
ncbi:MAG: methylmalonyl-CoA epimerase [Candidatus Aminicenantes bacterium]